MKKVMFWATGDTVVNVNEPSQTFVAVNVQQKRQGKWITLENVHTKEKFSGYELGMQGLGLVGYRKDETLILA